MRPKRILIIQLRRIGDVLFTLPIPGVIKKNFPDAKIDFLVEPPSDVFVKRNPHVSETLVYEKESPLLWLYEIRRRHYDWVIDFHSNGRTLMLTFLSSAPVRAGFAGPLTRYLVYNRLFTSSTEKYIVEQKLDILRGLGLKADSWNWDLALPFESAVFAGQAFEKMGISKTDPVVGIAPASRRELRTWGGGTENFAKVAQHCAKLGYKVILFWGPGELPLVEDIKKRAGSDSVLVSPKTTLMELAALIQKCRMVVAVDNGPKNLAVALNVPTVSVFGPTDPLSFNPHNDPKHISFRDASGKTDKVPVEAVIKAIR